MNDEPQTDKPRSAQIRTRWARSHRTSATAATPNMARQEEIAHPHQICGATQLDCTTCHDPHGKIRAGDPHGPLPQVSRYVLADHGVAFVHTCQVRRGLRGLPQSASEFARATSASISNTRISNRSPRMPMSVDEPQACYKCHPEIYAQELVCRRTIRSRKARWFAPIATTRTDRPRAI